MRTYLVLAIGTLAVAYCQEAMRPADPQSAPDTNIDQTRRQARQLNIPAHEYRGQNRQVIKIPSHAKVKVKQTEPQPSQQQQRPNRSRAPQQQQQPQQHSFNPNQNQYQNRPRQPVSYQNTRFKKAPFDDDYYDVPEEIKYPKKPMQKLRNGYAVQDVSPEEFYDESEEYEMFQKKPKNKKPNQKKHKKPVLKQFDASSQGSERRPIYDEETGYDFGGRHKPRDQRPFASHNYYDDGYGYDDYTASSSLTMKQVAAPNLAPNPNSLDNGDGVKQTRTVKKQMHHGDHHHERFQNYPTEPTPVKKSPSTRHMQSMFPQQYTTHNPFVTRNLGLEEHERASYYNQGELDDDQHLAAASEQRPALLPTGSSSIHIVKPPQFGGHPAPMSPNSNQRATIRDILLQDCPDAEALGYCASPPRYPTQQINNIMGKCGELLDAMYSPAPLDPEDDLSSFSSRSDDGEDIQFIDSNNKNRTDDMEDWVNWSRSSSDSPNTVCDSVLTQTEPGYAREVTSGRWFVVMQTMDAIVQRVMTDTCVRPGKPCGGLVGLKCSRSSGFPHGYKATRCVQRYTQQRLVSWDPETPQKCPKVRVFRFPTACVCHLSVE